MSQNYSRKKEGKTAFQSENTIRNVLNIIPAPTDHETAGIHTCMSGLL